MAPDGHRILKILADELGIESDYTDNWNRIFRTAPETARTILEAMGIRVRRELLVLDPRIIVRTAGAEPPLLDLYLAVDTPDGLLNDPENRITVHAAREGREEEQYDVPSSAVELRHDETAGLERLSIPLPEDLPVGSHAFSVEALVHGKRYQAGASVLVCPPAAYVPPALSARKRAGIAVALYGLRSSRNWGVGDFRDLKELITWAAEVLGVDFVGLNPLHATFNQRPYNHSPYLPSSQCYRNFIYLSITDLPDFAESPRAQAMAASREFRTAVEDLRNREHVAYEDVAELKVRVLREVFRSFLEHHGPERTRGDRREAFERYRDEEGTVLLQFATFCALSDHFSLSHPEWVTWRDWPEEFRSPDAPAVEEFARNHPESILFWMYVQWQTETQLAAVQEHARSCGMLIGLYHDLSLAVDVNGADAWAGRQFFHDGFRVGAPPDAFAPQGQDWGFAPPNREAVRRAAYAPFLNKLRANCRHGGALRIDHVMQVHHLFWIPERGTPREGVYVRDHEADLMNLLAWESQRNQAVIIGEDLGTVPFDFRTRLMEKNVLSYRLFYFERDAQGRLIPAADYPVNALVSISTHDLPTLAGYWSQQDIAVRKNLGLVDDEEKEAAFRKDRIDHKAMIIERLVQDGFLPAPNAHAAWETPFPTDHLHRAVLRFVLNTPCLLAGIAQEDLFLDDRRQNLPGTTFEHPNWVTKMRYSIEDLGRDPDAVRYADTFAALVRESGRSRQS